MGIFPVMKSRLLLPASILSVAAFSCGGSPAKTQPASPPEASAPDSWEDWKSYTNVSPGAWVSKTHNSRFVEIYVNDIGLEAYKTPDALMPVGSIVVKPSWENEDGVAGRLGPLFVMEKKAEGFDPDNGDWFYAFQWAEPPQAWEDKIGKNVDWRSPSKKVDYCVGCHNGAYDRSLGMPPKDRDWNTQ